MIKAIIIRCELRRTCNKLKKTLLLNWYISLFLYLLHLRWFIGNCANRVGSLSFNFYDKVESESCELCRIDRATNYNYNNINTTSLYNLHQIEEQHYQDFRHPHHHYSHKPQYYHTCSKASLKFSKATEAETASSSIPAYYTLHRSDQELEVWQSQPDQF